MGESTMTTILAPNTDFTCLPTGAVGTKRMKIADVLKKRQWQAKKQRQAEINAKRLRGIEYRKKASEKRKKIKHERRLHRHRISAAATKRAMQAFREMFAEGRPLKEKTCKVTLSLEEPTVTYKHVHIPSRHDRRRRNTTKDVTNHAMQAFRRLFAIGRPFRGTSILTKENYLAIVNSRRPRKTITVAEENHKIACEKRACIAFRRIFARGRPYKCLLTPYTSLLFDRVR